MPKKPTLRQQHTALAKIAGYHDDTRAFKALCRESQLNYQVLNDAYWLGRHAKINNLPCECENCAGKRDGKRPIGIKIEEFSETQAEKIKELGASVDEMTLSIEAFKQREARHRSNVAKLTSVIADQTQQLVEAEIRLSRIIKAGDDKGAS